MMRNVACAWRLCEFSYVGVCIYVKRSQLYLIISIHSWLTLNSRMATQYKYKIYVWFHLVLPKILSALVLHLERFERLFEKTKNNWNNIKTQCAKQYQKKFIYLTMILILILIGVVTLFYIWLKWNYSYWQRNNVPGPKPIWFVGNIGPQFTFSEHWGVVTAKWYK